MGIKKQNKTLQMKLVAAAQGCLPPQEVAGIFKHVDTNGNGTVSLKEIKVGLEELAASHHHKITAADKAWTAAQLKKDDCGNGCKIGDFGKFAHAVAEHCHLC